MLGTTKSNGRATVPPRIALLAGAYVLTECLVAGLFWSGVNLPTPVLIVLGVLCPDGVIALAAFFFITVVVGTMAQAQTNIILPVWVGLNVLITGLACVGNVLVVARVIKGRALWQGRSANNRRVQ